MFDNLSFARFKAYFRVLEPVQLPPYTGSTFRGAFEQALRRVCYGRVESCPKCSARSECRYGSLHAYIFESPWDHPWIKPCHEALSPRMRCDKNYPQPFIPEPPVGGEYVPGDLLSVPFTLVGKAISCLPFIACALSAMESRRLGSGRGHVKLERIMDGSASETGDGLPVFEPESGQIGSPKEVLDFDCIRKLAENSFASPSKAGEVRIRFSTPFRYRYDNKFGQPLTFEILMRNLYRRFTHLSVHSPISFAFDYKNLSSMAAAVSTKSSTLKWYSWERYSTRQDDWMNLDGYLGEIVFSGGVGPFLPYLLMGTFLNVGKGGSFGLGKYDLSMEAAPS